MPTTDLELCRDDCHDGDDSDDGHDDLNGAAEGARLSQAAREHRPIRRRR